MTITKPEAAQQHLPPNSDYTGEDGQIDEIENRESRTENQANRAISKTQVKYGNSIPTAMEATIVCGMCDQPGSATAATEINSARSNVREFGSESFTVWRCNNCRSIHSLEPVRLNHYYRNYPIHQQKLDFLTRLYYRNRLALTTRLGLQRRHSVLDYGCGGGAFVDYLKRKGYDAHGHDPFSSPYDQPIQAGTRFDVVIADQVVEHASDPEDLIRQWSQLTKSGGLLIIGCPDPEAIDLTFPEQFIHELHQPYHRHLPSAEALMQMASKAGFSHRRTLRRVTPWQPFINRPFLHHYMQKTGGFLDILYEDPAVGSILASPGLLARGLFGGLLPCRNFLMSVFTKDN